MRVRFRRPLALRRRLVQGIMAGGVNALYRSVEGAEDERGAGALAIDERGVTGRGYRLRNQRQRENSFRSGRARGSEKARRANDVAHLQSGARPRRRNRS